MVCHPAIQVGFVNGEEGEALGNLTSTPPYSSIKVSNTSLDHLLLGKAVDETIIRLCLTARQICVREPGRLAANWGPHSEMS